jgi:integrase/recombinase XerD
MKLLQGVQTFVEEKKRGGTVYAKGAQNLASFCRHVGDVTLTGISEHQVASFLEGPRTSANTWQQKYNLLRSFFLFWVARNEMLALPMPPRRPPVVKTFVPYIYSRAEIRLLLSTVRSSQARNGCKIDTRTFRAFLLFLYGTGALVGEARRLLREDVDFKRRIIVVRSTQFNRSREIPIGPDLYKVLRRYHTTNYKKDNMRDPHFFLTKKGDALNERAVGQTFDRLRRMAGIARNDGGRFQPRMHDLRHTFAVHRLTTWIKRGADLNRMIPALSVYMGQVGLGSTDRYLALAPERFRAQLDKLSPQRGKKRWRDNPALIKFLTEL